jgi:hypothetical protein
MKEVLGLIKLIGSDEVIGQMVRYDGGWPMAEFFDKVWIDYGKSKCVKVFDDND